MRAPLALATLAVSAALVALPARAADADAAAPEARVVEGVRLASTVGLSGRALKLNGAGLRKKLWFKVYVGALYLEAPSAAPASIVASTQHKRLELVFLRDVDRATLAKTLRGGFEKNSRAEQAALRERLDALLAAMPDVKRGDRLVLDFVPGEGVQARMRAMQHAVPGDDFGRALLKVWLGPEAPRDDLFHGLVGGGGR